MRRPPRSATGGSARAAWCLLWNRPAAHGHHWAINYTRGNDPPYEATNPDSGTGGWFGRAPAERLAPQPYAPPTAAAQRALRTRMESRFRPAGTAIDRRRDRQRGRRDCRTRVRIAASGPAGTAIDRAREGSDTGRIAGPMSRIGASGPRWNRPRPRPLTTAGRKAFQARVRNRRFRPRLPSGPCQAPYKSKRISR